MKKIFFVFALFVFGSLLMGNAPPPPPDPESACFWLKEGDECGAYEGKWFNGTCSKDTATAKLLCTPGTILDNDNNHTHNTMQIENGLAAQGCSSASASFSFFPFAVGLFVLFLRSSRFFRNNR